MLQLLKRNDITSYFSLLIWGVLFKLIYVIYPDKIHLGAKDFQGSFISMSFLFSLYQKNVILFMVLSFSVQFVFSILLTHQISQLKIIPKNNLTLAFIYLLLTSFLPIFTFLTIGFWASGFIYIGFYSIFHITQSSRNSVGALNVGLLLGCASLFYFPSLFLLPFFIFTLYQIHSFQIRDFIGGLLGVLIPLLIYFSISMLSESLYQSIHHAQYFIQYPISFLGDKKMILFYIIMILLLCYSLMIYVISIKKFQTITRKKLQLILLLGILSLLFTVFSGHLPNSFLAIPFIPFTILLSQTLHLHKEKMNNFAFWILVGFLLCFQWLF